MLSGYQLGWAEFTGVLQVGYESINCRKAPVFEIEQAPSARGMLQ